MPKRIRQADIDDVWQTYITVHGDFPLVREEVKVGIPKLFRTAGIKTHQHPTLKFVSGRNTTRLVQHGFFNINLVSGSWRDIVRVIAARSHYEFMSIQYKLARRVCEQGWLAGALAPVPKPKRKLTKEEIRASKIASLEVRLEAWRKKQQRTTNAIRKINRSLNALRRHQQ